jgi:hypothetical protein
MACSNMISPGQSLEERALEVTAALRQLEARLAAGQVQVQIGPGGALALVGWSAGDRNRISDACAYRTLSAQNSWALRQAVARAEARSGRKLNPVAIANGVHSHDDGQTWQRGH